MCRTQRHACLEPPVTHGHRRLAALQLAHLHDLSQRWIRSMDASLADSTILRRFLAWGARGFGTDPPSSPETDRVWQQFNAALGALSSRFERAASPTEPLSPELTDRFVTAAMAFIEPEFVAQEAWEDEHLPQRLPDILVRHSWAGRVGEAPGEAAPAPAAPGPWFGAFRYTVDAGGERVSVHIHNHVAPDSPFSDAGRLFGWFVEMVEHISRFEPTVFKIGTGAAIHNIREVFSCAFPLNCGYNVYFSPDSCRLFCIGGTWLNNSPAYQSIFPPGYGATLSRTDGSGKGMGAWGQYVTSGLELNTPRADMLRTELRFSQHQLTSTVTLGEFKSHVRRELAKANAAPKL